jgi:hypothetical protein
MDFICWSYEDAVPQVERRRGDRHIVRWNAPAGALRSANIAAHRSALTECHHVYRFRQYIVVYL